MHTRDRPSLWPWARAALSSWLWMGKKIKQQIVTIFSTCAERSRSADEEKYSQGPSKMNVNGHTFLEQDPTRTHTKHTWLSCLYIKWNESQQQNWVGYFFWGGQGGNCVIPLFVQTRAQCLYCWLSTSPTFWYTVTIGTCPTESATNRHQHRSKVIITVNMWMKTRTWIENKCWMPTDSFTSQKCIHLYYDIIYCNAEPFVPPAAIIIITVLARI